MDFSPTPAFVLSLTIDTRVGGRLGARAAYAGDMRAFATRYTGPPTLRGWMRDPQSITSLQVLVVILALVPGAALATLGMGLIDTLTPSERVPAVVTARDSGLDEEGIEYHETTALADDGRGLGLGTGAPGLLGAPVVVTLSTVTGELVAVRTASDHYRPHRTGAYVFLVVVLLATIVIAALIARRMANLAPWTLLVIAVVVGFVGAGGWQVASTAAVAPTSRLPAGTGMSIYTNPKFMPASRSPTGQDVDFRDATLRVTGPVTSGAPAGSASWLSDFHVMVVPFSASYRGTSGDRYVPLTLIGDGSGTAERVAAEHCGPTGFDGRVPAGSVEGVMCFVTPPDFQPRHIIVGTGETKRIDLTT
ncbi:hypothetical protein BC793_11976 [Actinoplanes xinjiangensis]|uniref:Uncharacterized protein n=2 Tax=Actinoplanes xinjiangensis TaxID=512350 RepID=A0A316F864_9ACTN|nr:hypothetical protein BC793_11976 [Actinoplanes xinjiangensis]GIF42313.1 hypothetical protein Axi01nite_66240 [Actinoplanes xinjiangensis]